MSVDRSDQTVAFFDRLAERWDADHGPGSPRDHEFQARLLF
jgi:hypothetical protein